MKRILIIRSGAVGDLILTLPVLAALKKRYNGISIDMMGDPVRLSLLKQGGYVDNALSVDDRRFTPLFAPGGTPTGTASEALRFYDAILSYLPDPDGVFAKNLRRFATGPVLTGRTRSSDDRRIHVTRVLMDVLKLLGADTIADLPAIHLPLGAATADIQDLPSDRTLIAIHPGSGGLEKCWPTERYAALIERLIDRGCQPVVTFGPADNTVRRRILPRIRDQDVLIVEDRPLVDMAVLYARCHAMIGNDSGMTHLAAAAGTAAIALFGPTDPAVWGPRGKQARLLWGTGEIETDVGRLTWKEPFRPRSLADIHTEAPIRMLANLGVSVGTAV